MAFTQFTNLDFDQIRSSIKDHLRANTTFTDFDFEGSNFSVLIDILAYNTYITAYNTNMVANEAFIDSATIRENVVSAARNIGYVPQSRKAAKANISFALSGISTNTKTATVKAGIVCTGNLDNTTYIFSIPEDITVGVSNGSASFNNIEIYEGTYLTKFFDVDTYQPNQKFIIPNPYVDVSTIRINVTSGPNDTTKDEYVAVDNIVGINSESQIFLIQEVSDEKYEIFFGDGVFGKKLSNGDRINVSYIVTNGSAGNGASNFTFSGEIVGNDNTNISNKIGVVVTNQASDNGDSIQSIDSIRYYAPRLYASQHRAVTANDYEAILPSIFPNIESVTAYGGEELSPPQYGKVFIAAKPKNSNYLSEATKESIISDLKKYTIAGIQIEFVDINVLYVELDTTFYYNSNFIGSVDTLKSQVISSMNKFSESPDLNKFGGRFKYSQAIRIIDSTNSAITSNITKVKIRRNVGVLLNQPTQYKVCFENKFSSVRSSYNIRSSGFYVSGVTSVVYISDIVNSDLVTGTLFLFSLNGQSVVTQSKRIGTVNYNTGEIDIDNITVISTLKPNNIIEIEATPYSNDIVAKKTIYLKLDVGSSKFSPVKDVISSGENSSGSRFEPESSYSVDAKIRN